MKKTKSKPVVRDHQDMILHPIKWPCWPYLPLKKANHNFEDKNLGILLDTDENRFTVYHVNLFAVPNSPEGWKAANKTPYQSVTDLLRDGWEVD
jgi:hypothetical protein